MAKALIQLATDPALHQRLGQAGHALVERKHSWQAHGEHLGRLFEALVDERRRNQG